MDKIIKKNTILILICIFFLLCAISMFYYGYKTFYVKTEENNPSTYSYHFTMIGEEEGDPYWDEIYQGALEVAKKENIKLEYIAPKKANELEALSLIDRMISAKVDGIITYGISGDRFVDLMLKASERNLPIITMETDIKSSVRQSFIGLDNHEVGNQLGEHILKNKADDAQIGVIVSDENVQSQKERLEGLRQALDVNGSSSQLITVETSGFSAIGAAKATYNIFKSYPETTDIIALNALDGEGVLEGLQDIVLKNDIDVYSFATDNLTMEGLDERIHITEITYDQQYVGREAIQILKEFQEGNQLHQDQLIDFNIVPK